MVRAEPIMLNKVPIMLCCTAPKNLPIYAQIKCDPHSENQPSGLFQVCLGDVYFHNFSMLADIGPLPSRFDSKTLVDC